MAKMHFFGLWYIKTTCYARKEKVKIISSVDNVSLPIMTANFNDGHTGSKFEMDVATFGLDFLEECTTQGRTRSPSDGVPLFQGSFCSIIPWPIRWHEYDTLQMILGIFRHHGAHSCRLSGSNNLLMWLAQHGCLRTELNQFVANS